MPLTHDSVTPATCISSRLQLFNYAKECFSRTSLRHNLVLFHKAIMASATGLDVTTLLSIASTTLNEDDADHAPDSPTLSLTLVEAQDSGTVPSSPANTSTQSAEYWASLIRQSYNALCNGGTMDTECLKAPRRRHAGMYYSKSHRVLWARPRNSQSWQHGFSRRLC